MIEEDELPHHRPRKKRHGVGTLLLLVIVLALCYLAWMAVTTS